MTLVSYDGAIWRNRMKNQLRNVLLPKGFTTSPHFSGFTEVTRWKSSTNRLINFVTCSNSIFATL